jgi:hypothetical protein
MGAGRQARYSQGQKRDAISERGGLEIHPPLRPRGASTHSSSRALFSALPPPRIARRFRHPHESHDDGYLRAGGDGVRLRLAGGGRLALAGGLQGTVWTLIGHPERGYDFLYSTANHASTAGTWVEEQLPRDLGNRTTGDFADAEASAVFLHLMRILLAREAGDTLVLLQALPRQWIHPARGSIWTMSPRISVTCALFCRFHGTGGPPSSPTPRSEGGRGRRTSWSISFPSPAQGSDATTDPRYRKRPLFPRRGPGRLRSAGPEYSWKDVQFRWAQLS